MKKIIIGGVLVLSIVFLPQKASASWWGNFIDWVRNAPPSTIEQIKNEGPGSDFNEALNNSFRDTQTNSRPNAESNTTNNPSNIREQGRQEIINQRAQQSCAFSVNTVKANDQVSFPLTIRGAITNNASIKSGCTWGMFEGTAGSAQLYYNYNNQGWKTLGVSVPIQVANWTSNATSFNVTLNFNNSGIGLPPGTPMKVVFKDENAKDGVPAHTYELPIVLKNTTTATGAAGLTVLAPQAETLRVGVPYKIVWRDTRGKGTNNPIYVLNMSEDGGKGTIAERLEADKVCVSGTCSYTWTPPYPSSRNQIMIYDVANDPQGATVGRSEFFVVAANGGTTNSGTVSLTAQLLATSEDKAGTWNNFGPGVGNINKNPTDWSWQLILQNNGSVEKWVKRVTVIHNTRGEVWSTGYSRYLADGTDLFGNDEHPYPLVMVLPGGDPEQQTYKYDAGTILIMSSGSRWTYKLYGQKENTTFTGGKVVVEFTDGTSARTTIPAGDPSAQNINVDVRINGQSAYAPVKTGENFTLSYTASGGATYCRRDMKENAWPLADGTGYWDTVTSNRPISWSIALKNDKPAGTVNSISISCFDNNGRTSTGSGFFSSIAASTATALRIVAPTQGTFLRPGQVYQITYTGGDTTLQSGYTVNLVPTTIRTYKSIGTVTATGPNSIGILPWTVPTDISSGTYTIKFTSNGQTVAESGVVTIESTSQTSTLPSPRIVSPNGGEQFRAGSNASVKWYGGGNGEKIKFDLVNTTTGTATWIANDIPLSANSLYFDGTISSWNTNPLVTPGEYKIRMTRQADNVILDESDRSFSILPPLPGISADSPSLNDSYYPGQVVGIKFNPQFFQAGQTYDIKLMNNASNGIVEVMTIGTRVSATTYNWAVPASLAPSTTYSFKICPTGGPTDQCGYSSYITVKASATASPCVSCGTNTLQSYNTKAQKGSVANVFYAIGDLFDEAF